MISLIEQFESQGGHLQAVTARLEHGEDLDRISPSDWVAALAFLGLGDPLGPALVRASSGHPKLKRAASEPALATRFPRASRPSRLALSAGLLQVLDFWDESHEAAQESDNLGESRVSAYWHGIAHRREPDPGNAAYWFRRVGRHPVFLPLAEQVARLHPERLKGSTWDPVAFIGFCGEAALDRTKEPVARGLQRLEMLLLLDASLAGVLD